MRPDKASQHIEIRADFNGLFGDLLCLSHSDTCEDESGTVVHFRAGMRVTVFEIDEDERGVRDDLIASGVVEPSPDELQCKGSKWVLRIDAHGVRLRSQLGSPE